MEQNDTHIPTANGALISVALSLHVFWILNLFKEASPSVKEWLTFYNPVGPLSGLFIVSLVAFVLLLLVLSPLRIKNQQFALWFFIVSTVLFALMVFPPVFKIFVE